MEPTIFDGDTALFDESHQPTRNGTLRTGDGPLVKCLHKRDHRWWADSDNEEYEPQLLDGGGSLVDNACGGSLVDNACGGRPFRGKLHGVGSIDVARVTDIEPITLDLASSLTDPGRHCAR